MNDYGTMCGSQKKHMYLSHCLQTCSFTDLSGSLASQRNCVFECIVRGCCQIFKKRHFKHELSWCIFMVREEVWFNASWLWGDPVSQSPCPLACLVMGCSGGGGQSVLDVLIKRHCLWALCLPKCTWEGTLLLCDWVKPRASNLVWCWRFLNLSGECSFLDIFKGV